MKIESWENYKIRFLKIVGNDIKYRWNHLESKLTDLINSKKRQNSRRKGIELKIK